MRRRLIVLRPEPGNSATCLRIEAAGGTAVSLPLFAVRAIEWMPPDPARFDMLVLTSANAVRHAGPALARYATLPVIAVGAATAHAAAAAGLRVAVTGARGARALSASLAALGAKRVLHLAGREHRPVEGAESVVVYASDPIEIDVREIDADVALVHSARAGARLAELVPPAQRPRLAIAAISLPALAETGDGWAVAVAASLPTDEALIASALSIDPPRARADKTA
jgi:uroporphyrinogen-III synthase